MTNYEIDELQGDLKTWETLRQSIMDSLPRADMFKVKSPTGYETLTTLKFVCKSIRIRSAREAKNTGATLEVCGSDLAKIMFDSRTHQPETLWLTCPYCKARYEATFQHHIVDNKERIVFEPKYDYVSDMMIKRILQND